MRPLLLAVLPLILAAPATAAEPLPSCPVRSADELLRMNRCELESLYRSAGPAAVPCGYVRGTVIMKPGTAFTVPASRVTRLLWQGKYFTDDGLMVNRVFGIRAIHARVYHGTSILDGQPSLIMDYNGTSRLFPKVWDEVREVSPGLYLGLTYIRKDTGPELATFFALSDRR